jgi:hypothetical protein
MSSKKKYIMEGVSALLLPLVIGIVSKLINRYIDKYAGDAPEVEKESFARIRKV